MIPKIIHYCWFGGNPLPELAVKCIESWKKYCPDYEIKEWNESNFDINCCNYVKEAYQAKKWAFVSDYARFWILYNYGGLYFDTDVEIIKPIDEIVEKGAFMGVENDLNDVAPGLGLAANPGLGLYKEMLDFYKTRHFIKEDGSNDITTVVEYTTSMLKKYGLKQKAEIQCIENIYIYPKEYFCPIDEATGIMNITDNTYSIHHYAATWRSESQKKRHKLAQKFRRYFDGKVGNWIVNSLLWKVGVDIHRYGIKGTIKRFNTKK